MAEELAKEVSARFRLLARYFWPGALTIIAPASSRVPLKVTGNTGRIAMRQSKSKVANALLERLAQPLISTSANLSGQPTCASGIECFGMMDGRVDLVLDGGLATGTGATTVDVTEPYWRVIKEGAIAEKGDRRGSEGHVGTRGCAKLPRTCAGASCGAGYQRFQQARGAANKSRPERGCRLIARPTS